MNFNQCIEASNSNNNNNNEASPQSPAMMQIAKAIDERLVSKESKLASRGETVSISDYEMRNECS